MQQTMNSINRLFEENYDKFLLPSKECIKYTEVTDDNIQVPCIAVYDLKTYLKTGTINAKNNRNMTIIQIDIYTKSKYMSKSRKIRDKLTAFIDNKTFNRKNYTNLNSPVNSGLMRFKRTDEQPFYLDNHIKVISLTYEVEWQKPIPKE